MIKKIDHIAIAVDNLDDAIALYKKILGVDAAHREYVEEFKTDTATFKLGDSAIELVEGKTEDSAIRKFVDSKGPGIHHIAVVVEDIEAEIEKLKSEGVRLIDEAPRRGKENSRVAFIHPKSTDRVLYELVEPDSPE
jgi:methylmalonyl-CoA/ethylmalonyl-CoA epimerase